MTALWLAVAVKLSECWHPRAEQLPSATKELPIRVTEIGMLLPLTLIRLLIHPSLVTCA